MQHCLYARHCIDTTPALMKRQHALTQYLAGYGEPLAKDIADRLYEHWPDHCSLQHCLIIPAYRETPAFFTRLKNSALMDLPILIILVVNQPDTDPDTAKNAALWQAIAQQGQTLSQHMQHRLLSIKSSNVLLLNCFDQGYRLPTKQGVGLARKIGCDLACHLFTR